MNVVVSNEYENKLLLFLYVCAMLLLPNKPNIFAQIGLLYPLE